MTIEEIKNVIDLYESKVKSEIEFDEALHQYTRKSDGFLLTGTTTILGVRGKDFLKYWSVKEGVKHLGWFDKAPAALTELGMSEVEALGKITSPILTKLRTMSIEDYWKLLDEAKKAFLKKTKKATDKGTKAHDWCEVYIKNKIAGRDRMESLTEPKDEEVKSAVKAFLEWERANKVHWLSSELVAWNAEALCAGTIDFIAIVNGKFTLGDFKTSNQISEDAFLQTAAYQSYLELAGIKPEQRLIVRIPKDSSGFEALVVPTPYEFDRDTFYRLREVHRWNQLIENQIKDK